MGDGGTGGMAGVAVLSWGGTLASFGLAPESWLCAGISDRKNAHTISAPANILRCGCMVWLKLLAQYGEQFLVFRQQTDGVEILEQRRIGRRCGFEKISQLSVLAVYGVRLCL